MRARLQQVRDNCPGAAGKRLDDVTDGDNELVLAGMPEIGRSFVALDELDIAAPVRSQPIGREVGPSDRV